LPSRTEAQAAPVLQDEALHTALAHAQASTRRAAVRELHAHPDGAALLRAQLLREDDASVREAIVSALIALAARPDDGALETLIACLRSDDAELRNRAIEALGQLPEPVARVVPALLRDADADVRIFAVNVLALLPHADVELWLIELIERESHVNVCGAAVDVLSELGTQACCAPLQRLRARFADEPFMQFAIDLALRRATSL
jgi:HEAT repeat protein